jgi:hypothetical protein
VPRRFDRTTQAGKMLILILSSDKNIVGFFSDSVNPCKTSEPVATGNQSRASQLCGSLRQPASSLRFGAIIPAEPASCSVTAR